MTQEELFRMMQNGQHQQEPYCSRKPTKDEVRLFVDRCIKELGYSEHSLDQAIRFELEQGVHSIAEAEMLPLVLKYINTGDV